MAMLPAILREVLGESMLTRHYRLLDHHIFGLLPEDFVSPLSNQWARSRWCGEPIPDRDKIQVSLDVEHFNPEEITVKAIGDSAITVEGKHEEKRDAYGYVSRHFVRRYALPEGHTAAGATSSLSADGVLTIRVPKIALDAKETSIPIKKTGPFQALGKQKVEL